MNNNGVDVRCRSLPFAAVRWRSLPFVGVRWRSLPFVDVRWLEPNLSYL